ncbi:DUF979 domain-containing protein [Alicyclobacillus sendaiensis]|uniref:DUF979 domain-containing protein n=1 Tax=Alicyclobacillus sendaiensis TaxID=192387 RepID=UPI00078677CF|nr:DUF979 domain-containing protein [Alicyclobacillus sendaiensis]
MIRVQYVYDLVGLILVLSSLYTFRDGTNPRRITTGLFYLLYGLAFILADFLPPAVLGVGVLAIVAIAGFGGVRTGSYREASAEEREASRTRLGNWLFIPAVLIPLVTVAGVEGLGRVRIGAESLLDSANVTLVALGIAAAAALIVALAVTRSSPVTSVREARRLIEAIGWAAVLPQMLAVLGTLFASAGVGTVVANVASRVIPHHSLFWAVFAYCVGMALFTMVMGNAFAAFPVMTAGIAIPLIIGHFGVDANRVAAIGMFAGYCGTLLTPMAANFNIVPAALLNLRSQYAVIRAQWPTAVIVLAVNILLMYALARW